MIWPWPLPSGAVYVLPEPAAPVLSPAPKFAQTKTCEGCGELTNVHASFIEFLSCGVDDDLLPSAA